MKTAPIHQNRKSKGNESSSERRQSRRLNKLPPINITVETENKELLKLNNRRNLLIGNIASNIKIEPGTQRKCKLIKIEPGTQRKCKFIKIEPGTQRKLKLIKIEPGTQKKSQLIDNTCSNNQGRVNKLLTSDTLLNNEQNSIQNNRNILNEPSKQQDNQLGKNIVKIEPIDDFLLPNFSEENESFFELDELRDVTDRSIYNLIFDIKPSKKTIKNYPSTHSFNIRRSSRSKSKNKNDTLSNKLSKYKTMKLIRKVILGNDTTSIRTSFGRRLSSETHLKTTDDNEGSNSFNEETRQSLNNTVKPINRVKFNEDATGINMPFTQHQSFTRAKYEIFSDDDETSDLFNEGTQLSLNDMKKTINRVLFGVNSTSILMPFSQHKSISKAKSEISSDDNDKNSVSFNEETQQSLNNTVQPNNSVMSDEYATGIDMPLRQHKSINEAPSVITLNDDNDKNGGLVIDETRQSQNYTVQPNNRVMSDEYATGIDMPLSQQKSISEAPLVITIDDDDDDENGGLVIDETRQSQNDTIQTNNRVMSDEYATGIDMPLLSQQKSISEAPLVITIDDSDDDDNENGGLVIDESWQSQNDTVQPNNYVIFNEDLFGNNMPLSLNKSASKSVQLKFGVNYFFFNEKTRQIQPTLTPISVKNKSSPYNVNVLRPLHEIRVEIENNDLAKNKTNRIDERTSSSLSFPRLRVISAEKLFDSPRLYAIPDNLYEPNYDNNVTQSSDVSINSNPNVEDSEQTITNNDSSIPYINNNQNVTDPEQVITNNDFSIPIYALTNNNQTVTDSNISYYHVHDDQNVVIDAEQVITNNDFSTPHINNVNDNQNSNSEMSDIRIFDCWSISNENSKNNMEITNENELANEEIRPEITETANVQTLDQTQFSFSIPIDCEQTQSRPKKYRKVSDSGDKLPTHSTDTYVTRTETKTDRVPQKKSYFDMSMNEKKLYKEKLVFVTALKLVPVDKGKSTLAMEIKDTELLSLQPKTSVKHIESSEKHIEPSEKHIEPSVKHIEPSEKHIEPSEKHIEPSEKHIESSEKHIEQAVDETSSDILKCSYILEFPSDPTENQKHTAVPVMIPDKSSGSPIHAERKCSDRCSSCHYKFNSVDVLFHIAQIKDPVQQKTFLENASHLIGPTSCLCGSCYHSIENQSNDHYIPQDSCIVHSCTRLPNSNFNSMWLDQIRLAFLNDGDLLRTESSKQEYLPICKIHLNKIEKLTRCQLCSKHDIHNLQVTEGEALLINKNFISSVSSYLCKTCYITFVSKAGGDPKITEQPIKCKMRIQAMSNKIGTNRKHCRSQYNKKLQSTKTQTSTRPVFETIPKLIHYRLDNDSGKLNPVATTATRYKSNDDPTIKAPTFVPVLKPSDNFQPSTTTSQIPVPVLLSTTIQIHPYQKPNIKPCSTTLLLSEVAPVTVTETPVNNLEHTACLERKEMELFNKMVEPHSNWQELVDHLLQLEEFRELGYLVKADDTTSS